MPGGAGLLLLVLYGSFVLYCTAFFSRLRAFTRTHRYVQYSKLLCWPFYCSAATSGLAGFCYKYKYGKILNGQRFMVSFLI